MMKKPETIKEFLDGMDSFLIEGRKVDTSDLSHDAKVERLLELQGEYGLA